MSKKHLERFNENFEPSEMGRYFISPSDQTDLSNIKVLYSSVDTVRQIYKLHIDPLFLESLDEKISEEGYGVKVFKLNGHDFMLKRGGASGYKYILQNADLGLILLVKHHKTKGELSGPHLKIEVSPKVISSNSEGSLQLLLDNIADLVALDGNFQTSGCALHMALDIQGWEPPSDFTNKITCRSKRLVSREGISELFLDKDVCSIHGKGQSYLFGSASSIQLSIYNKSLESKSSDKLDYMQDCWSQKSYDFDTRLYDSTLPVWRFEIRFHHSVINQFSDMNISLPSSHTESYDPQRLTSFESLVPHLGGLWSYGLNNFRYDLNSRYVHPVWTVLMTESAFDQFKEGFSYKRKYKTAGVGNERNIAICLGNMLSIFARNKLSTDKALEFVKKSGIYADLVSYFKSRGLSKSDIRPFIEDGLIKRRLSSKVVA